MTCSSCHRPAADHPVAYYDVGGEVPVLKCWPCLSDQERTVLLDASLCSHWRLKQSARRGLKMLNELAREAAKVALGFYAGCPALTSHDAARAAKDAESFLFSTAPPPLGTSEGVIQPAPELNAMSFKIKDPHG